MDTLAAYKEHLREIGKLESALSLLNWDQRTNLPRKGHPARAEVIGKLTKMVFSLSVSDKLGEYLEKLQGQDGLTEVERASVRVVGKAYLRHKVIPPAFYEEYAIAAARSETAWEEAKEKSDFELFKPHLERMVDYARKFAEYYGYDESPYDALIEEFEPGMTSAELKTIIEPLRSELVPFIKRLMEEGKRPKDGFMQGTFPEEMQRTLSLKALSAMNYDFDAGRLDQTVHPFTTTIGPSDVRITTRYLPHNVLSGLASSMHEGGHALYDQGIPDDLRWSGLDEGASFGIHESQSRMWENLVGRSRPFWTFFAPIAGEVVPQLSVVSAEDLYRAVNIVKPSLVRVEADEVTYNLHIMLRFELEQALITGEINVSDLPGLWRDAMKRYLGVVPEDDAHGVLQDVHWSSGLFGYFPSYMLGNLYSAQFFAAARREITDLDEQIAGGKLSELLAWLRENIHQYGKMYEPKELVERITGEAPNSSHFVRYIVDKYTDVYGLR
ncbi:MAG TPA: carboxypeptidase M32 [Candidatus Acetothermia bacterium]|nr:carboxypeptidase M32 [Candidatus Acetothermia bacterium]